MLDTKPAPPTPPTQPRKRSTHKTQTRRTITLAAALTITATTSSWPIYQDWHMPITVITAITIALTTQNITKPTIRIPLHITNLLITLPTLNALSHTPPTPPDTQAWAIIASAKQLLSLTTPVANYQATQLPLAAFCYLITATGTALNNHQGKTRHLAAYTIPAPLLFATIFGPETTETPHTPNPTLTPPETLTWILAALLAITWQQHDTTPNTTKTKTNIIAATGIILAAHLCILPLHATLAKPERQTPRTAYTPTPQTQNTTPILSNYRQWKQDKLYDAKLFTITLDKPTQTPIRIRLAAANKYTGTAFTTENTTYTKLPHQPQQTNTTTATIKILENYKTNWLPIPNNPTTPPKFQGPHANQLENNLYYNKTTETAILTTQNKTPHTPKTGTSYTIAFTPTPQNPKTPHTPTTATTTTPKQLKNHPQMNQWIKTQKLPAGITGYTQALQRLRAHGYLSHALTPNDNTNKWRTHNKTQFTPSRAGHTQTRIEQLFKELNSKQQNPHPTTAGDDEQFAAAAYQLAKAYKLQARIILGVRVTPPGQTQTNTHNQPPTCTKECRGQHISAWIEIRDKHTTWQTLDVTPQNNTPPNTKTEGTKHIAHEAAAPQHPPTQNKQTQKLQTTKQANTHHNKKPAPPNTPTNQAPRTAATIIALTLLAALPGLTLLIGKKTLNHRLHKNAKTPEQKALTEIETHIAKHLDLKTIKIKEIQKQTRQQTLTKTNPHQNKQLTKLLNQATFSPQSITTKQLQEIKETLQTSITTATTHKPLQKLYAKLSPTSLKMPPPPSLTHNPKNSQLAENTKLRKQTKKIYNTAQLASITGTTIIITKIIWSQ